MSSAEDGPPESEPEPEPEHSRPERPEAPEAAPGGAPAEDAASGADGVLSRPHRMVLGAAAVLIASAMLLHIGATFFHISPQNVVRDEYGTAIRGYLYPEFRQGWNLFGPELPRNDTTVHARAQIRHPDGSTETTGWVDITAADRDELRHNVLPSRTRHQLRKAWTDVLRWQTEGGDPIGRHGADVRRMATSIALPRLDLPPQATAEQIQFRTVTTPIPPPPWQPQPPGDPTYREHDWWPVTEAEATGGSVR